MQLVTFRRKTYRVIPTIDEFCTLWDLVPQKVKCIRGQWCVEL